MEKLSRYDIVHLENLKETISSSGDKLIKDACQTWTDETLLIFIRCRNYNIQSAFEKVRAFVLTCRVNHPDNALQMYPSRCKYVLQTNIMDILKNVDQNGRRVLIFRYYNRWNLQEVSIDDLIKALFLYVFELLQQRKVQENGIVLIWDLAGMKLAHVRCHTIPWIRKHVSIINGATPLKLKSIHVLNAPTLFNMIISLIKMTLSTKIKNRFHVHGSSLKSLHNEISTDILPISLGGKLSEKDAMDTEILKSLLSLEKDKYYKNVFVGNNFCS